MALVAPAVLKMTGKQAASERAGDSAARGRRLCSWFV